VAGLIAVPALAQSNVTISGRLAAGWENYDSGNAGANHESRVSDQSSRLIFNVVEDLGGGLKAWGQIDARFSVDTGGQQNMNGPGATGGALPTAPAGGFAGGNTGVGFMHANWGKFTIGRWDVHYNEFGAINSNRAGSLQSNLGLGFMNTARSGATGTHSRTPNLLMWDSPNWNGFTARLGYSTFGGVSNIGSNEGPGTADRSDGHVWTGALRYNNGPWTAGVSHWSKQQEQQISTTMGDEAATSAWAGYTFGMGLKVGLGYNRSAVDASAVAGVGKKGRGAWMLPISYSFGPHAIYFQYARAGKTSSFANSGANAWGLGYDYAFSKRTSVGVFYTKINNDSGAAYNLFQVSNATGGASGQLAAGAGADPRQFYIGMAHNF
jgi:hypothetical protein